ADLVWVNPSVGTFQKANVYGRLHGSGAGWTLEGSTSGTTAHSFTVTGLVPGKAYDFRVAAVISGVESAGDTSAANLPTAFTGTAADFLGAQTVTGLTGQKFRFTWSDTDFY